MSRLFLSGPLYMYVYTYVYYHNSSGFVISCHAAFISSTIGKGTYSSKILPIALVLLICPSIPFKGPLIGALNPLQKDPQFLKTPILNTSTCISTSIPTPDSISPLTRAHRNRESRNCSAPRPSGSERFTRSATGNIRGMRFSYLHRPPRW